MKSIIRFSMKNTVALLLLIGMILAGGVYSVQKMNIEEFPNVDIPYLGVFLFYPGASAEQAMNEIGKPLEAVFKNIDGVKNIYSRGFANGFYSTLEFDMSTSIEDAERELRDAISQVRLPNTVESPQFHRQSPSGNPAIFSVGIYADQDQDQVQQYVKDTIVPQLEGIKGIEKIELSGSSDKKVYVKVLPEALKEHNLSLDQVKQAIIANNLSIPTGEVILSDQLLPIRVDKKLQSLDDLENIQLAIVSQDMSSLTNAFESIGDGMEQLGSGVQAVGDGLGTIGEIQGYQQAQIQILVALQGLSAQLMNDQMEYQKLLVQEQESPNSVPAQKKQELETRININEQQITQLQNQFQQLSNSITNLGNDLGNQQSSSNIKSKSIDSNGNEEVGINLAIKTVRLGEIAEVAHEAEWSGNFTRINGKTGVVFEIIPEGGQNVVAIVDQVQEVLEENPLPEGYQSEVLRDQSIQIEESVYSMLREALLGALMAVIVTLLFLRNLRSTIIAVISIPLSILASFIVLDYLGYTLNLLTLSGIAVAVGRVVDDSIVVIENIFRRVRIAKEKNSDLVESSTREVATAITSSTITTVAVFLPLAFVDGIVGKFFAPLAWTVVISLLFSLLVAITVVPLFSRIFLLKLSTVEHKENQLQKGYRSTLNWALRHRFLTLGIATTMLIASVVIFVPQLGFNFLPKEKVLNYSISMKMPMATAPDKVDSVARQVEAVLLNNDDIRLVSSFVSGSGAQAGISFVVKDEVKDVNPLIDELRTELAQIDQADSITIAGVGGLVGTASSEFVLVLNGPNIQTIKDASKQVIEKLREVPGLADVRSSTDGEKPEIMLQLNEDKLAEKALYPGMVGMGLRNLISGETVTTMELDAKTTDLLVGLKMKSLSSLEDLGEQTITNMIGENVAIKEIADIEQTKNPTSIMHLNQKEYVMIQGTITDTNSSAVINKATEVMNSMELPPGVSWYKEGASEAMDEGFTNMGIAIAISIFLVYLVMIIAFGEATAPFVILFAIPFSAIGALIGLFVVNEPIGMPAMVGLLMLNGIVVTNAIVLLDRVRQNERSGMNKLDALIEGGVTRVRPILMTAIATIGALSPLMLSTSGGLLSKSLAVVVVGGLSTSTALTLIIVPVLYSLFHRIKKVEHSLPESEAV